MILGIITGQECGSFYAIKLIIFIICTVPIILMKYALKKPRCKMKQCTRKILQSDVQWKNRMCYWEFVLPIMLRMNN